MWSDLLKRWFDLTLDEHRALALILALFLIGLIARTLIYRNQHPDPLSPNGTGETFKQP